MLSLSEIILHWYDNGHRILPWRGESDAYRIWVSEIMLQQTRAETVEKRYPDFIRRFPTVHDLASAPLDDVLKAWEGLGYYARARNLHKAANVIVRDWHGILPDTAEKLRTLPGVGAYAACSVASIAFGEPVPALDANLARIFARVSGRREPLSAPSDLYDIALSHVPQDRPGDFNQALMDLGAGVCLQRAPKCAVCPLAELCIACRSGSPEDFPQKLPKPPRREIRRTILLIVTRDGILLRKRPSGGLLGGLWEFPAWEDWFDGRELAKHLREYAPSDMRTLPDASHVFTHLVWRMRGIAFRSDCVPEGCVAADADLLARVAMPSALRVYRECASEILSEMKK